jgi:COP9 signalosome complex subunit 4
VRLSNLLEAEEDWKEAAQVLIGATQLLDSSSSKSTPAAQAEVYVHIVRLLLEADDPVNAETYLNRAGLLMPDVCAAETMLQLSFRVCQARIADYKRRFLDASLKYHELSMLVPDPAEQKHALTQSILTAVLANAGPQRTRALNALYKDERCRQQCDPVIFGLLERVLTDRLLEQLVVEQFRGYLSPHHLATLADGQTTVLDRSIMEHNIMAISKLYRNIGFSSLARLLGPTVGADKAEGRVRGYLDQSDGFVYFEHPSPLERWNDRVVDCCAQLDHIIHLIKQQT